MNIKSLTLEKYFEFVKPKYIYIQIIPHKSLRNNNSSNIAKAITYTWKTLSQKIRREQRKLFFETDFKISYVIDIYSNNANFYFLIPEVFKGVLIEKISEIWNKATIQEVEGIPPFPLNSIAYQVGYKKEDALSIGVDKKSNEPLNSMLSVMEIMKEQDRLTVVYNFLPTPQYGWFEKYNQTIEKIKDNKPILKDKTSVSYVIKTILAYTDLLFEQILGVVNDFLGSTPNKKYNLGLLEAVTTVLDKEKELSPTTKKKKEARIIESQIAVISGSLDKTRQDNNALAVCQSYRVLDEDNELIYRRSKEVPIIEDYRFRGMETNSFSTDECQNFIQLPARTLLKNFGINHINTNEIVVPKQLQSGTKLLGNVKYKGSITKAYLEDEYNIGNLPLVLIGSQGGGKTTYMGNYANFSSGANESVVVIDFIKNCGLSDTIKSCVSKDKVVEIDLGAEDGIQGLGYNEITITDDMSAFDKLKLANLQSQQIMSLVDSISIGDPLSSRMRRFLNASATIVFSQGFTSVKNVIECLENYKRRKEYIDNLSVDLKEMLKEEVDTLMELDEWTKATKDNPSEVVGTKESKIEHILDRVSMLREDFKLKFMYNKPCDNNINLVECMEQGKVILIKMKESDFPTKMIKNILVTYWTSKVWLSVQLRGVIHDKPLRTNILIDEVFQAPTTMKTLEYIVPQSRKFGCKFVFSTQYIRQLDAIFDTLDASGASYMLLTGATENDFKYFESRLTEFEYEDLKDMEQYSSLNLIYYSGGYASFISKLPPPIKE